MREEVKRELEQELLQYPILQYAFLKTGQVSFPDRVRTICRQECPQYGPPGPARRRWERWRSAGSAAKNLQMCLSSPP